VGFNRGNFFSALGGLIVGVMLVSALPALGAAGDDIVAGQFNDSGGYVTRLKGKGNPTLRLINWNGRAALELRVSAGTPPMKVNSTGLVTNLNADLLDGMQAAAFAVTGHDHDTDYLAIDGTAADSGLLDGLDSTAFAATGHGHDWGDLSGVPAGLDDGDHDTLGDLVCPTGQVAKMTASGWACADDDGSSNADTLDGIDSPAFVGGRAALGSGLPSLGFGCLYEGGFLLALARDGSPYCSEPTGDGMFTDSGQDLALGNGHSGALGDLDGDGDLDAFVANFNAANTVWFNDGNGTLSDSGQSLGSDSSQGVALGDLDGDGDLDAYVANGGDDRIWVNDGSGTFTAGQSIGVEFSRAVALGDLDGDGDLDVFIVRWYNPGPGSSNLVLLNDGSGAFTNSGQALGTNLSMAVALGDMDGDGDLDAYVGNGTYNRLYLNDGTGSFSDSANGEIGSDNDTRGVALADLDGDGDLDVFDANSGSNVVWFNDGDGILSDSGVTYSSTNSFAVALGDLDGDGYLDAYITDYSADDVWTNDGDGTFTDSGQSLDNRFGRGVALGDLDGDGDLDAYVINEGTGDRVWLD
jgi:hypothetical protein